MDELIFFSIPGLVIVLTIIGIRPTIINSQQELITLALLTPLAGYILHQTFRLGFELTGGYSRDSRAVVKYIVEKLATQESISISKKNAFHVWEITFYDTKDFSGFRDHDARSFHYTLAFWSTSFASIFGIILTGGYYFFQKTPCFDYFTPMKVFFIALQIVFAIIFWIRGNNVYKSINEQEVAFLLKNKEEFKKCMFEILEIPLPIKHIMEVGNFIIDFGLFQKKITIKKDNQV